MSWPALVALAVGAYGFKALGLVVVGDRLPGPLRPLVAVLPAALFSALVVVQTLGAGDHLVLDARLVGTAAAGVAVWRRAPFVVVVLVGVAVTAVARLV